MWLESSLDKSFKSSESSDTSSLSVWYDIRESVNKTNATQSSSSNYPTYSNSINYIQAVKFDGTSSYLAVDVSSLNNTNYTIFVLEQRESSKSGNYFIGDSSSVNESNTNKNLVLGYSADGTIKHSQSSDNSYTSSITSYSSSLGKPRVFTFVHDKSSGKKTYINGLLAATSTDTNHLSGMTTLTIGKSYQGQIGEVVMFARALNAEERQAVEDYLGKKWNSKILRSVGGGSSCVGGIVSDSGCQLACSVPAITGITTTSVSDGSGIMTCSSENHFSGSVSYSCSNSVFTRGSGSCSCASGYAASGSNCVVDTCSFSGVTGITDGTPVNYTTTSVSQICNASGYTGSVTYTCSGGGVSPTIISNSCVSSSACTGGATTDITVSGTSYKVHSFTSSGTLTCSSSVTAQVLVVGGGGAGGDGMDDAGGGGSGGIGIYGGAAGSGGDGTGGDSNSKTFNNTYTSPSYNPVNLQGISATKYGAGGGGSNRNKSGSGAAGIVIIRYPN